MDMREIGDSIGGIYKVWISKAGTINPFPSTLTDGEITQTLLDAMELLPVHPYRPSYTETPTDTDQGQLHSKIFTTGIPLDTDTVRTMVTKYQSGYINMIIQDLEFKYWLIFGSVEPGFFVADYNGGRDPVDGKLINISISQTTVDPMRKLTL
jgi:hypothetical protein